MLTGIEVASYEVDLPGKPSLADVIETVASAAPTCASPRLAGADRDN